MAYDGYLGDITIDWSHNHEIMNANALTLLRMSNGVKNTALRLFQEGVSAAGVKQILQDGLVEDDGQSSHYGEVFYDRHQNPSY